MSRGDEAALLLTMQSVLLLLQASGISGWGETFWLKWEMGEGGLLPETGGACPVRLPSSPVRLPSSPFPPDRRACSPNLILSRGLGLARPRLPSTSATPR